MKKTYIEPVCELIYLTTPVAVLGVYSGDILLPDNFGGNTLGDGVDLSRRHHSTWEDDEDDF